jgi:two-component system, chemotaxis family, protein-glutamate methylesterase/glutaminase
LKTIKVLLVEDDPTTAAQVQKTLALDARFELHSVVDNVDRAVETTTVHHPLLVLINGNLPRSLAAIRVISAQHATVTIVLSDRPNIHEEAALRQGAVGVCKLPEGNLAGQKQFCSYLYSMSSVRVIRRKIAGRRTPLFKVLGIVASTGGPQALKTIFKNLDSKFPLPILLVQHITAEFSVDFVDWLSTTSSLKFETATAGTLTVPGTVYVAPPGAHLSWKSSKLFLTAGEPECWQLPSGNVLLRSLAENAGSDAIGVVLTGLGEDGALGLLKLRQAGGHTIAQDEASSAVYGMPKAACALGAALEQLPLNCMGSRLKGLAAFGNRPVSWPS